ncbi:hypothetical protein [Nocardia aurantiaca]|uniref:Uncharacterized protein n=1 Tax=Nocardia aurantiaca TaxID=2675850 RepID=A0A6I3KYU4_9NOCA|nr:hypothetical protein [Nocardia aurantiaca]MTE12739.1 hypothetical protein [Nocardia aurantiaca]
MRKIFAVTAMALGVAGLGAATAHAETLTVDGNYASVEACAADGNNGQFQAGGVQLRGEDGWQWRCDQGNDGLWYMTIFR